MLANISEFDVLLERYENDPALCSKLLRTFSLSEPSVFLTYAQEAILQRPVSRVMKFIAGLAIAAGFIELLLQVFPQDRARALELAKRMFLVEPRFDVILANHLSGPNSGPPLDEGAIHTILDLLAVISEGDRLVPTVLKVLKHPNPKIRSKAALFVGARTQNIAWATSRSQEFDPRVRANILESLAGVNNDMVHQLFRNHVVDDNNRAAGNAILGLYLLGDPESILRMYEMAKHPDPLFRNTCAWLIGRTSDSRFGPLLAELMQDPDELVRSQGFKSLGELKKTARLPRPQLSASIVRIHAEENGGELLATFHDEAGQPVRGLPGTGFIPKSGTPVRAVRRYSVEEYDCKSSLNVAFVFCLPEHGEAGVDADCVEAVETCYAQRRSKDRWAVVKIGGATTAPVARRRVVATVDAVSGYRRPGTLLNLGAEAQAQAQAQAEPSPVFVRAFDPKFEYALLPARLHAMLGQPPLQLEEGSEDTRAKVILDTLLKVDIAAGKPNLIFIGAGPESSRLFQQLIDQQADLPAAVHVLAISDSWASPEVRRLVDVTGGCFQRITAAGDLRKHCLALYSSLLHHYRLSWSDSQQPSELELNCPIGRATTTPEAIAVLAAGEPRVLCSV